MTNELKIFENPEFGTVRTIRINDEPWFVAVDICKILGIKNNRGVTARLDDDEKGVYVVDTPGGDQKVTCVNESGLYNIMMTVDPSKAKARGVSDEEIERRCAQLKRFKRWVTHDILPDIRKHGAYITPSKLGELLRRPESVMEMLTALSAEQQKNAELTEQNKILAQRNEEMQPKEQYYDKLVDVNSLMNFTDTAKAIGINRKKMLDVLVKEKYLYRQGSHGKLIPYEKSNRGYFEVKEQKNAFGSWAGPQTFVTVAGRQLLLRMLDESYFD